MAEARSSTSGGCPKKRAVCQAKKRRSSLKTRINPGPLTNNAFLNYLRYYRKNSCSTDQKAQVSAAAKKWNAMNENKKCKFRKQAEIVRYAERVNRLKGFRKK